MEDGAAGSIWSLRFSPHSPHRTTVPRTDLGLSLLSPAPPDSCCKCAAATLRLADLQRVGGGGRGCCSRVLGPFLGPGPLPPATPTQCAPIPRSLGLPFPSPHTPHQPFFLPQEDRGWGGAVEKLATVREAGVRKGLWPQGLPGPAPHPSPRKGPGPLSAKCWVAGGCGSCSLY